ncbi:restriction endonuclease [Paraburkholderia tagetis]|uniref:Restriction endonuclease n=1 Tax=Paraburkholderia tagetis TaxID=2913261 RepID=A0A9X1RTC6_9BURK|nr:restriction endonuclease [Paraburkholderia tagetis]MCG5076490.1 restriction endonuclease [Paraburkholderia tagetis]
MSLHVHADYAPPRSWEQFEELCADVFQSAWRDPALVRHGRAGQRQNGVDIVGRNGAIYPIGIQCKRRSKWPVSKLTIKEVDAEIKDALNFKPSLKVFYILTTAPDDVLLLDHVRRINEQHEKQKLFEVVLLGWGEIVRRATIDPQVANKHFGPSGGGAPHSPLLATWMMSKGKLEKTGTEFELSVIELIQDLHDWPNGHIVIRQRESDALLEQLRSFEGKKLSIKERKDRIKLRDDFRVLTDAEKFAERGILLMLTDPDVSVWLLTIWEQDAPLAIEAFVNNHLRPWNRASAASDVYLRMSPPGDPERRCSTPLSQEDVSLIWGIQTERQARFGNPLTDTVDELPPEVRARVAIPRLVRGILEFISEERLSWDQVRQMKALDFGRWTISIA